MIEGNFKVWKSSENTGHENSVSTMFSSIEKNPCKHSFEVNYWDHHGRKVSAHGGEWFMIRNVVTDDKLSEELYSIGKTNLALAKSIWSALYIAASTNMNTDIAESMYTWRDDGEDRVSVAQWYKGHIDTFPIAKR